jgi:hypothetical protein
MKSRIFKRRQEITGYSFICLQYLGIGRRVSKRIAPITFSRRGSNCIDPSAGSIVDSLRRWTGAEGDEFVCGEYKGEERRERKMTAQQTTNKNNRQMERKRSTAGAGAWTGARCSGGCSRGRDSSSCRRASTRTLRRGGIGLGLGG